MTYIVHFWKGSPRKRYVAMNMLVLLVLSLIVQIIQPLMTSKVYALSPVAKKLVGVSRDDTRQHLTLNTSKTAYEFSVPDGSVANSKHGGRNASVYSTSLSLDPKKGITYTDTVTKIPVTITPKFATSTGEKVEGDSIVYPSGADQLVYTHKYNGLKENIIVASYRGDNLSYSFEMQLPAGVEARKDSAGNIGIYSADPILYGTISYGSDKDRANLDRAKLKAKKSYLVAIIPAPIIKDANSVEYGNIASFALSKQVIKNNQTAPKGAPAEATTSTVYELTVTARPTKRLAYPIAIDPTIASNSASDFSKGNNDGSIDVDNANSLIRRAALTGGTVGSWSQQSNFLSSSTTYDAAFAYNNRMYLFSNGSGWYVNVASDGSVSGQTAITNNKMGTTFAFYNGYFYSFPDGTGQTWYSEVQTDGNLSTWTQTSTMAAPPGALFPNTSNYRQSFKAVAANGYVYVSGGCMGHDASTNCNVFANTVEYAKINADGSLGAYASTSSFTTGRFAHSFAAYNGYLYIMNGTANGPDTRTAQYAVIRSDGSLGSWITTTSVGPSTSFLQSSAIASNGYLYVFGGYDFTNYYATVYYAQINADGSLGGWATTTSFTTARSRMAVIATNGYFILAGGISNGPTYYNDVQHAKIDSAGISGVATTDASTFTTARSGNGTVVANGYIYIVGGCTVSVVNCNSNAQVLSTVYMAAINSDGTIGSWSSQNALPSARGGLMVTQYNNYIYAMGGAGPCGTLGAFSGQCAQTYYASINPSSGTVGSWNTGTVLPVAKARGAAAAYGGYIYAMGGRNGSNAIVNTLYYTSVNQSTGAISGTWTAGTINDTLEFPAATAHAGYMYIASGWNGSFVVPTVSYATISSNGSLGSWTTGSSLVNGRDGATLIAYNSYLYFIGGLSFSTVEYATINTNGSLGTFANSPNSLNTGYRRNASGGIYGGRIYVAGGDNSSATPLNSVDVVPINNGGSGIITSWTNSSSSLPAPRALIHGITLYNGYVYVPTGTTTGGASTTTMYYASLSSDGTFGSWNTTTAFAASADAEVWLQAYNGRMYATPGPQACNGNVLFNTINSNGTLGASWTTASTATIPGFTCKLAAQIYHGRYYIIGGWSGSSGAGNCTTTVRYATIDQTNGTLGAWTTSTAAMSVPRGEVPQIALYNGYLYVVGGVNYCGGAGSFISTVEVAQLDTDGNGTVGNFALTTPLQMGYDHGAVVAVNGYLYTVGGQDEGSGPQSRTRWAPILAGGRLGQWESGGANLNTGRAHFGLLSDGRRLIAIGGHNLGSTYYSSIEVASVQSIKRSGSYSCLIDFDKGVKPSKLVTRGFKLDENTVNIGYSTTNNAATSFTNSQISSDAGYNGANDLTFNLGSNVSLSRYLILTYTIDDSRAATFPDDSNQSTITDYDIYFTPNASLRLRGGQTFTTQQDRGLEASPL